MSHKKYQASWKTLLASVILICFVPSMAYGKILKRKFGLRAIRKHQLAILSMTNVHRSSEIELEIVQTKQLSKRDRIFQFELLVYDMPTYYSLESQFYSDVVIPCKERVSKSLGSVPINVNLNGHDSRR
jgi:hypothetical protein